MAVISAPVAAPSAYGKRSWRDLDWISLLLFLVLSLWGVATVVSATKPSQSALSSTTITAPTAISGAAASASTRAAVPKNNDAVKQAVWVLLGVCAVLLLSRIDYQLLMHLQLPVYLGSVLSLILLLVLPSRLAPMINGAKSWILLGPLGSLQPSEFAKFAVILSLSAFLCRRQEKIREARTLLLSLLYVAPFLLLILKQPDFGTMLTIIVIWFGTLFFGGARLTHLGLALLIGLTMFGVAWKTDILKPHQRERLAVFLDPNPSRAVARKEGYQITQSQIAIGGGQIGGQGFGKGMQNRADYVPEKTTDFVFSVVAEEFGFIGGAVLLLLYLLLLSRIAGIAISTDNYFGVLIAGGFASLLAFHTIINLGMTMRVMPLTGVPLPFFSYGGSSYLAFSMCLGMLQSIASRRRRILPM